MLKEVAKMLLLGSCLLVFATDEACRTVGRKVSGLEVRNIESFI